MGNSQSYREVKAIVCSLSLKRPQRPLVRGETPREITETQVGTQEVENDSLYCVF